MSEKKKQKRAEKEARKREHENVKVCTCQHSRNRRGGVKIERDRSCPLHGDEALREARK